jgi:hypothetical protein
MEDFDWCESIQAKIDDCLEAFDLSKSNLCIGQYKEDEVYYRCQVLEWMETQGEARCLLIDFGTISLVSIETITSMSDELSQIKPYALVCKLKDLHFDHQSDEYKQMEDLVTREIKFDVRMKKTEFDSFPVTKNFLDHSIDIELFASQTGQHVDLNTLKDKSLWENLSSSAMLDIDEIKEEPVSVIIEHALDSNDENDETKETNKNSTKISCKDNEATDFKNKKDREDDEEDDKGTNQARPGSSNQQSNSVAGAQQSLKNQTHPSSTDNNNTNSKMCANLINDLLDQNEIYNSALYSTVEDFDDKEVNGSG